MVAASQKKPPSQRSFDSGADVSVLYFAKYGKTSGCSGVIMQDASGRRIPEVDSRILEVTDKWGAVKIKEKFSIANVVSHLEGCVEDGTSVIELEGKSLSWTRVPIKLRRNTLVVAALVSAIAAFDTGPPPPQVWATAPGGDSL